MSNKFVSNSNLTTYTEELKQYVNTINGCKLYYKWLPQENGVNPFKLNLELRNVSDAVLSSTVIDFPLEQTIVDGTYDSSTKELILFFQSGNSTRIPLSDLFNEGSVDSVTSTVTVDDTTAYVKNIPATAAPYSKITKIGGMSYKSKNLFGGVALANKIKEVVPNVVLDTSAGTIHYTSWDISNKVLYSSFKPNTQYTFIITGKGNKSYVNLSFDYDDGTHQGFVFSTEDTKEKIRVISTAGKTITQFRGNWSDGNTTLYYDECGVFEGIYTFGDFVPYFSGLRDAKVTEVKSMGANLIPYPYDLSSGMYNGVTITFNNDGSFTFNGAATSASYLLLKSVTLPAGTYYVSDNGNNDWKGRFYASLSTGNYFKNSSFTLTEPTLVDFRLAIYESFSGTATFYPMVNRGTEALHFAPYTKHTLAIPESESLEGYGLGVNNTCYNYIDFESKKFNRVVDVVDLGTINWDYDSVEKRFLTNQIPFKQVGSDVTPKLLNGLYTPVNYYDFYDNKSRDKTMAVTSDYFYIRDLSYTDVNAFKSAMSGVMLVYELATPTTEDIPEISNLIGVEGGGTLTFENEYGYDVPSELEYTLNSNDVIAAKEFVGNLKGTAEVAKYYDVNGNISTQTIGEALSKLLGAGNPIKITADSIGQLSTTTTPPQVLTGISDNIVANPPVAVDDIILDKYLDGDAAYLCFWLVTAIEPTGAYSSNMTLQGAGNIYVGGGSASVADKAIADGNGNNIVSTYETKAEAQTSHGLLASNIVTNANNISTNSEEITNIKNRIINAETTATTAKSEATMAATSAAQLAGQLIDRAECTYAPDYSQGGAMALKLTLYTKEGQAIQVSGFQTAIDNYFGDILV